MVKEHKKEVIESTVLVETTNKKLRTKTGNRLLSITFDCLYKGYSDSLEVTCDENPDEIMYSWSSESRWLVNKNQEQIATEKRKHATLHGETCVLNQHQNVIAICRTKSIVSRNHTPLVWIVDVPESMDHLNTRNITNQKPDITIKGDFALKRCIWYDTDKKPIVKLYRDDSASALFTCEISSNVNCDLIFSIFLALQKMIIDARAVALTTPVNY